ncbi:MAG: ABC transporter permease [Cellvibrionales bacterium]|jgi:ABC-2 type transport system permease protein|nr:ABC transporter permease [Cellvibrionales bacterium]HRF87259.1 ABC transporter permease [Pseudomonadales bacterium]HRG49805.1 ABC transporter permease [Pseudomonadales bacterium]
MNSQETWIAFSTILTKEIRRFLRIWMQTLLPPAITTGLYFVIFGTLIGSRIGEMQGYSYIQFVVPGLVMMSVLTNSYSNVVSSFFSNKFQHSIEELLVAPVPNWAILAGYVAGGVARGICVGIVVTILSLFFSKLHVQHWLIMISAVLLTSVLFSLLGLLNAIFAKNFDDISIIPTFVLTPLTYLGGVFYSIDLLPPFWKALSQLNPILYMVNAFRYGMLGISDVNVSASLGMIALFSCIACVVALRLLNSSKGLRS